MPAEHFLRFRSDDGTGKVWLRRGLFYELAWRRVKLQETASPFPSEAEAMAFAERFKFASEVELVTVIRQEVRRA